jgi:hypothetical protein
MALSCGNQADISLAEELTDCLPEDSTLIAEKAKTRLLILAERLHLQRTQ